MIQFLIDRYKLIVVDGALATRLEHFGCNLNDPLWSAKILMEQPELITQIHETYYREGADIAITASYQASIPGFMNKGLNREEAIALIQRSVSLANRARERFLGSEPDLENRPRPMIAGSIGSYGAYLADGSEFTGDFNLTKAELIDFHRPRMEILANPNQADSVDFFACETIPCIKEARALVETLATFPEMTAWITFSAKDGDHLSSGEPISEAAAMLDEYPQILAIGVNCTSPEFITPLARNIKEKTYKPIVVYPNSGETFLPESRTWDATTLYHYDDARLDEWYAAGVRLIGGCCRTGPDAIAKLARYRFQIQNRASCG